MHESVRIPTLIRLAAALPSLKPVFSEKLWNRTFPVEAWVRMGSSSLHGRVILIYAAFNEQCDHAFRRTDPV